MFSTDASLSCTSAAIPFALSRAASFCIAFCARASDVEPTHSTFPDSYTRSTARGRRISTVTHPFSPVCCGVYCVFGSPIAVARRSIVVPSVAVATTLCTVTSPTERALMAGSGLRRGRGGCAVACAIVGLSDATKELSTEQRCGGIGVGRCSVCANEPVDEEQGPPEEPVSEPRPWEPRPCDARPCAPMPWEWSPAWPRAASAYALVCAPTIPMRASVTIPANVVARSNCDCADAAPGIPTK
mmetsp:Transcript_34552/g.81410  ORF Transcript_34552/g.81410 Transcript_34552/m.81410 type:complete len:243 (+) Transcript_34552:358-1086(+)